jgi:hypothetical protein
MADGKTLIFRLLGVDDASPAFKKLSRSAEETSNKLGTFSKTSAKVFAGFAGGALASGAAITGSLAAVGIATGAVAAVILHNNDKISAAAGSLWTDLEQQAKQGAAPLAQPITDAINKIHGTIIDIGPQIGELFSAGAPAVEHFAGGLDQLVRNVMPGLVTGAKNSEAAFRGLESFMGDAGKGVGDFFTNASKSAESAGKIFESTGHIIRDIGGFAGSLLSELADSGAPAVQSLEGFLSKLEQTVLSLGQGAFPILSTSVSGFLAVGSGILTILNGLAPILGPLIGQITTFGVVLKGVDAITFGGVGASWAKLKDDIGKAEGFAGKAKAAIGGLGVGLGPLAIVAGIATFALEGLGESQQKAAADAAAHESRIQSLTGALRESNGAINDNVRALAAKNLADTKVGDTGKDVLQIARESGINLSTLTDAYLGNGAAIKIVNDQLDQWMRFNEQGREYDQLGATGESQAAREARELQDTLPGLNSEYATSAQRARDLAAAQGGQAEASRKAADALKALQDQMDAMVNKDLAYRNAVDATKGAQENLTKAQKDAADALKGHGAKSQEYAAALNGVGDASRGLEGAYIAQAQAARDLAIANSVSTDEVGRAREGSIAYTQEVLNMAQAAGNNAPRALQQMVQKLSDTDIQALGATKKINELGQTVITLPNGKTITVNAKDEASSVIRAIAGGKYVATIKLQADWAGFSRTVGQGSVLSNTSARGNATGGWINGPGTETSDSIPRMLSNGEFVIRASEAAKYGPLLEAINSGRGPRVSGLNGGTVSGAGNGHVTVDNRIILDSREMSRFVVASIQKHVSDLGGDTQKALGGRTR